MTFFRSRPEEEPTHLMCILNNGGFRVYAAHDDFHIAGSIIAAPGGVEINGRKPTAEELKRGWMIVDS